jgi:hypothetical protein
MEARLASARESIRLLGGPPLLVGGLLILASLPLPWVEAPGDNLNSLEYLSVFAALYAFVGLWSLHLATRLARIEDRRHFRGPTIVAWVALAIDIVIIFSSNAWTGGRELGGGEGISLIGLIVTLVGLSRAKRVRTERVPAPTTPPPAGWYADPEGQGARWWDGQTWTEHRQQ